MLDRGDLSTDHAFDLAARDIFAICHARAPEACREQPGFGGNAGKRCGRSVAFVGYKGDQRMTFLRVCSSAAAACAGLAFAAAAWAAGPHEKPIRDFAESTVVAWVSSPLVIKAIKKQNARHAGLKESQIVALDKQWRAETARTNRPLIDRVLANDVSRFLAQARDEQHGIVTEVFIMDNRGLNVGQSDVTSDYWQGDETKWQKTFLIGPDAMIIDDVELDESTQTFQSQLSMSIADPRTGEVIGAITVGIDVEAVVWANLESLSQ